MAFFAQILNEIALKLQNKTMLFANIKNIIFRSKHKRLINQTKTIEKKTCFQFL
jgi:hypothetical protein